MVKYTGPRIRIIRKLGLLPGLTRKISKHKIKTPGQHGKPFFNKIKRTSLADDYKSRLIEKQKLRFNYGITEKQLISYYNEAKKRKGSTGSLLLELLESRLDCIVYRLGFAPSIPAARQLINHGHLIVNQKKVTIPSFICKIGDSISIKNNFKSKKLISESLEKWQEKRKLILKRMKKVNLMKYRFSSLLPTHLEIDGENIIGKVISSIKRNNVLIKINELKVVEYYSR
jgi:small subunit ribosomal protein S4